MRLAAVAVAVVDVDVVVVAAPAADDVAAVAVVDGEEVL
jgi:hypothetical protein